MSCFRKPRIDPSAHHEPGEVVDADVDALVELVGYQAADWRLSDPSWSTDDHDWLACHADRLPLAHGSERTAVSAPQRVRTYRTLGPVESLDAAIDLGRIGAFRELAEDLIQLYIDARRSSCEFGSDRTVRGEGGCK